MHKIHPLAGQGFNDFERYQNFGQMINKNLDLGLNLDTVLKSLRLKKKFKFYFCNGSRFYSRIFQIEQ